MIQEDYCSFEVAKLLKEKGFVESCYGRYSVRSKEFHLDTTKPYNNGSNFLYCAPTLQMAMKWLREVHNLHIDIDPSEGDWNPNVITLEDWSCVVKYGDNIPIQDTYEEAVEAALKYALKKLIV